MLLVSWVSCPDSAVGTPSPLLGRAAWEAESLSQCKLCSPKSKRSVWYQHICHPKSKTALYQLLGRQWTPSQPKAGHSTRNLMPLSRLWDLLFLNVTAQSWFLACFIHVVSKLMWLSGICTDTRSLPNASLTLGRRHYGYLTCLPLFKSVVWNLDCEIRGNGTWCCSWFI